MKIKNPFAKVLRTPIFKARVIRPKKGNKSYTRKGLKCPQMQKDYI
jgi:stalled ribosome alternative rescue factor ArfA